MSRRARKGSRERIPLREPEQGLSGQGSSAARGRHGHTRVSQMTSRVGLVVVTALIAGAIPAAGLRAQMNGRTSVDTTFSFDKSGTVVLGSGSATIVVTAWDQSSIRIRARAEDGLLRTELSARRVTIQPTRSTEDAMIQVTVPRGVRVEAHLNDG